MEIITLDNDIKVFYVSALSFPEGIAAAHQTLHGIIPFSEQRGYFGISRLEQGKIVYKAAAAELYPGDLQDKGLESMLLRKGRYVSETIKNYMDKLPAIKQTFDALLQEPGLDPEGYCVEWYLNDKDLKCMVRLNDQN